MLVYLNITAVGKNEFCSPADFDVFVAQVKTLAEAQDMQIVLPVVEYFVAETGSEYSRPGIRVHTRENIERVEKRLIPFLKEEWLRFMKGEE
ncbi:hypothetical protein KAU11_12240 [Candidatus Babeliales bacterium]|nr:hypothetical protein [Candidatus Babeliales bacterium]